MQRIERRATNDAGEEVTILEVRDEQVVVTTERPIKYKIQPTFYGPGDELLVREKKGVFRSPTGERFRTVTYRRRKQ